MDLQRFQQVLLNYLSNALKFTEKHGKISMLLQYVPPLQGREREVGVGAKDEEAAQFMNSKLDEFYGEDFLADSDSEEENDSQASDENTESRAQSDGAAALSLEEKYAFRSKQRATLAQMLTRERLPKILLTTLDSGVGIKVQD